MVKAMPEDEQTPTEQLTPAMAIIGVVVLAILVAAYLWGETHNVNTAPLLGIISPVIGAIFLVKPLNKIRQDTAATKANTNGHLTFLTARNRELADENRSYRELIAALKGTPVSVTPANPVDESETL